jgi:hypothetical protein
MHLAYASEAVYGSLLGGGVPLVSPPLAVTAGLACAAPADRNATRARIATTGALLSDALRRRARYPTFVLPR